MKNLFPFFALLLVIVASSFTTPAVTPEAAADYFLKIDGVVGESTDSRHKQWIEVESYSLNRATQTVQIVRKTTSRSSAKIALICSTGQHIKKATLHVRKSGADYQEIKLEDVLISSYQTSTNSGGIPMESFSLNFTKISY